MRKGVAVGIMLCSSLLLAEGSESKLSQQKPHIKESQSPSSLLQEKSIKIKNKTKSYPRGTISTH